MHLPKPTQTSTSWYKKERMDRSTACISQQSQQQQASRYYSASKGTEKVTFTETKSVKQLMSGSRVSISKVNANTTTKTGTISLKMSKIQP